MKIPSQAKKVFSGKIFDIYQWEQQMFDGTTAIFERAKRPYTIQVLPILDDNVVLIEDEQPDRPSHWTLVGGRIEEGEDPLTAAKREMLEETGLASDTWELYKEEMSPGKIDWVTYTYIARNCKKIQEPQFDGGEKIIVHPLSFDECIEKVIDESFHSTNFTLDILRKIYRGELDAFRERLLNKKN